MKTILKLLILLCISPALFAQLPSVQQYQTEQNTFWQNALNAIPQNSSLSGKMVNNKILYDKVTPFAGLFTFNEDDNNLSYDLHFRQALSEMYRASDKTLFESADRSKLKQNNM